MDECRAAFDVWKEENWMYVEIESDAYEIWQSAWNAATKNAVKICEGQMTGVNPVGDMAREECAEAIEQENA